MITTLQLVNEAYMIDYVQCYIFYWTVDLDEVNRMRASWGLWKQYQRYYPRAQNEIVDLLSKWVKGKYKLKVKTLKELLQGYFMRARVGWYSDIHGYSTDDLMDIMKAYLAVTKQV